MSKIKRGVSLYSYQEEYFHRKMKLEDCIKAVADIGATGVEIIPEQMINEYPNLSEAFIEKWFGWMEKYKLTPTCADVFSESLMFKNRILSDDELVDLMERDLKVAKQLGCFVIRTLCTTPVRIIEKSLPLAEKYNIKIGLEIHAPLNLDSSWFDPYKRLIDKYGSEWFGIIPDMGVFQLRPSQIQAERAVRDGANPKIVEYINKAFEAKADMKKVREDIAKMGANAQDFAWLGSVSRILYTNPEVLKKHKDYIFHIHGKFYNMREDLTDECLDYENVIKVLKEIGYDGYISSEYEGNRTLHDALPVDSVEQVARQHKMLKRLLGEE
ncbi:TIM barrel protein [Caloramator sp. E03]|uniref:sugar phosphate isomerase/epimerase family protein n=1 Tax=Caloramator sp. E03 TaxID=2576307 RepID=UPI0011103EE6|nr:TIM barrel protein [Caloramator sp. E03]QCX34310.1 TIM barrel protein [Caloramator sp. E03]